MKICWWQGGIHLEPETKAETDALMMLWEAKKEKKESPLNGSGLSDKSLSVVGEQRLNSGVVD